jgi:glycosyltransferase involved in cell wall biosynthesis
MPAFARISSQANKSMTAIHFIVDTESNWIPKQLFDNFRSRMSLPVVDDPRDADLIWIMSYYANISPLLATSRLAKLLRRLRLNISLTPRRHPDLANKFYLASLHHLVPENAALVAPVLAHLDAISDAFHIFSRVNAPYCGQQIASPMFHLPYWIDLGFFNPRPKEAKERLRRELGIPGDRIVIGSFQRDTQSDLVSPKLEKGPDILCDILEGLDPSRYFVLLSGPRRDYVEARLKASRMPYISLGFVDKDRMPDLYASIDVYLVTSRIEGGPQAILECMATRTPILSTRVGIADILPPEQIHQSVDSFRHALSTSLPDTADYCLDAVQRFDVSFVVQSYERAFEQLVKAKRAGGNLAAQTPQLDWVANHLNPRCRHQPGASPDGLSRPSGWAQ